MTEVGIPLQPEVDTPAPREIHIACEAARWRDLSERLLAASPSEGCTFVLTRPSRGSSRVTVILGEPLWPLPGEVETGLANIEINSSYISRALDAAIDAGPLVGLALVHTHPQNDFCGGTGRFSSRDDWYDHRLFTTVCRSRKAALSASIVIGAQAGSIDARIFYFDDGKVVEERAQILRVVGPDLRFEELAASTWKDHPDPLVMDRSSRLWGDQGRRILQNVRVGVAGAGGTGNIAILSLATIGVGQIRGWDKDRLKKENRHRQLLATERRVGQYKVALTSELAKLTATANPFRIEAFESWATSTEGLLQLRDCDVVFSCVDLFAPRVALNDLAYLHLIPVIDIASWIHATSRGTVDAITTHAQVLSPGLPCSWCSGILQNGLLVAEAQGDQRGAERRAPYGLPLEATDGVEPSVLPLNMLGVSLALMEFMQTTLRISDRVPRNLKFFLPGWELDESDLSQRIECPCSTETGFGDTVGIRPVEPPQG